MQRINNLRKAGLERVQRRLLWIYTRELGKLSVHTFYSNLLALEFRYWVLEPRLTRFLNTEWFLSIVYVFITRYLIV